MADLLPCPFCGGEAEFERKGDRRQSTIVSCTSCAAMQECGEEWDHGRTWNTRAPAQAQGWQPIETAPKDGTRVLVADENVWMTCARNWPCNGYWIEDAASGLKLNQPTHWMPCPMPPELRQ